MYILGNLETMHLKKKKLI